MKKVRFEEIGYCRYCGEKTYITKYAVCQICYDNRRKEAAARRRYNKQRGEVAAALSRLGQVQTVEDTITELLIIFATGTPAVKKALLKIGKSDNPRLAFYEALGRY